MDIVTSLPILDENDSFETWEVQIRLWQEITAINETKQAIALILVQEGKIRKFTASLDLELLYQENGVSYLLKELENHFTKNVNESKYRRFRSFLAFHRTKFQLIPHFIEKFECYKVIIEDDGMNLSEDLYGFLILQKSYLTEQEESFIADNYDIMIYEDVKRALLNLHETRIYKLDNNKPVPGNTIQETNAKNSNRSQSCDKKIGLNDAKKKTAKRSNKSSCDKISNSEYNSKDRTEKSSLQNGVVIAINTKETLIEEVAIMQPSDHKRASKKIHMCSICNAEFTFGYYLNRHMLTHHSKDNDYTCFICDHKCTRSDNMRRHINMKHKLKSYTCTNCPFVTPYPDKLLEHECA